MAKLKGRFIDVNQINSDHLQDNAVTDDKLARAVIDAKGNSIEGYLFDPPAEVMSAHENGGDLDFLLNSIAYPVDTAGTAAAEALVVAIQDVFAAGHTITIVGTGSITWKVSLKEGSLAGDAVWRSDDTTFHTIKWSSADLDITAGGNTKSSFLDFTGGILAVENPSGLPYGSPVQGLVRTSTEGLIDFSFLNAIDEDDMSSDSAVRVPTQQSVKAYVATHSS